MGKRSNASAERGRAARTPAGRASAAGTTAYCAQWASHFADDFFRPTRSGVTVSSLGVGTYLGESDDETDSRYAEAIQAALTGGVNVVDTAINYRCQRAERVVGMVLRQLFAQGTIGRDQVVVCTKGGYIPLDHEPPRSRDAYQEYLQREYVASGVLNADDVVAGGHAIAPSFLRNQLARSLANLRLDGIDWYYIHNPEQQLAAITREEFLRRMRDAFGALEECVVEGKISAYGCATWNGLRVPADSPGHLSLYQLEQLARDVAGERHHFRVVQLPVNLRMSEAVRVSTQRDRRGRLVRVTDAAEELGLDLVVSAPLLQGQLTDGLPDEVRQALAGACDAHRALGFARSVPGAVTVAVGARDVGHVAHNLASARVASGH